MPGGKNKKVIGLIKDELCGQLMKRFIGLGTKIYSHIKKTMKKIKSKRDKKVCHKKEILSLEAIKNV